MYEPFDPLDSLKNILEGMLNDRISLGKSTQDELGQQVADHLRQAEDYANPPVRHRYTLGNSLNARIQRETRQLATGIDPANTEDVKSLLDMMHTQRADFMLQDDLQFRVIPQERPSGVVGPHSRNTRNFPWSGSALPGLPQFKTVGDAIDTLLRSVTSETVGFLERITTQRGGNWAQTISESVGGAATNLIAYDKNRSPFSSWWSNEMFNQGRQAVKGERDFFGNYKTGSLLTTDESAEATVRFWNNAPITAPEPDYNIRWVPGIGPSQPGEPHGEYVDAQGNIVRPKTERFVKSPDFTPEAPEYLSAKGDRSIFGEKAQTLNRGGVPGSTRYDPEFDPGTGGWSSGEIFLEEMPWSTRRTVGSIVSGVTRQSDVDATVRDIRQRLPTNHPDFLFPERNRPSTSTGTTLSTGRLHSLTPRPEGVVGQKSHTSLFPSPASPLFGNQRREGAPPPVRNLPEYEGRIQAPRPYDPIVEAVVTQDQGQLVTHGPTSWDRAQKTWSDYDIGGQDRVWQKRAWMAQGSKAGRGRSYEFVGIEPGDPYSDAKNNVPIGSQDRYYAFAHYRSVLDQAVKEATETVTGTIGYHVGQSAAGGGYRAFSGYAPGRQAVVGRWGQKAIDALERRRKQEYKAINLSKQYANQPPQPGGTEVLPPDAPVAGARSDFFFEEADIPTEAEIARMEATMDDNLINNQIPEDIRIAADEALKLKRERRAAQEAAKSAPSEPDPSREPGGEWQKNMIDTVKGVDLGSATILLGDKTTAAKLLAQHGTGAQKTEAIEWINSQKGGDKWLRANVPGQSELQYKSVNTPSGGIQGRHPDAFVGSTQSEARYQRPSTPSGGGGQQPPPPPPPPDIPASEPIDPEGRNRRFFANKPVSRRNQPGDGGDPPSGSFWRGDLNRPDLQQEVYDQSQSLEASPKGVTPEQLGWRPKTIDGTPHYVHDETGATIDKSKWDSTRRTMANWASDYGGAKIRARRQANTVPLLENAPGKPGGQEVVSSAEIAEALGGKLRPGTSVETAEKYILQTRGLLDSDWQSPEVAAYWEKYQDTVDPYSDWWVNPETTEWEKYISPRTGQFTDSVRRIFEGRGESHPLMVKRRLEGQRNYRGVRDTPDQRKTLPYVRNVMQDEIEPGIHGADGMTRFSDAAMKWAGQDPSPEFIEGVRNSLAGAGGTKTRYGAITSMRDENGKVFNLGFQTPNDGEEYGEGYGPAFENPEMNKSLIEMGISQGIAVTRKALASTNTMLSDSPADYLKSARAISSKLLNTAQKNISAALENMTSSPEDHAKADQIVKTVSTEVRDLIMKNLGEEFSDNKWAGGQVYKSSARLIKSEDDLLALTRQSPEAARAYEKLGYRGMLEQYAGQDITTSDNVSYQFPGGDRYDGGGGYRGGGGDYRGGRGMGRFGGLGAAMYGLYMMRRSFQMFIDPQLQGSEMEGRRDLALGQAAQLRGEPGTSQAGTFATLSSAAAASRQEAQQDVWGGVQRAYYAASENQTLQRLTSYGSVAAGIGMSGASANMGLGMIGQMYPEDSARRAQYMGAGKLLGTLGTIGAIASIGMGFTMELHNAMYPDAPQWSVGGIVDNVRQSGLKREARLEMAQIDVNQQFWAAQGKTELTPKPMAFAEPFDLEAPGGALGSPLVIPKPQDVLKPQTLSPILSDPLTGEPVEIKSTHALGTGYTDEEVMDYLRSNMSQHALSSYGISAAPNTRELEIERQAEKLSKRYLGAKEDYFGTIVSYEELGIKDDQGLISAMDAARKAGMTDDTFIQRVSTAGQQLGYISGSEEMQGLAGQFVGADRYGRAVIEGKAQKMAGLAGQLMPYFSGAVPGVAQETIRDYGITTQTRMTQAGAFGSVAQEYYRSQGYFGSRADTEVQNYIGQGMMSLGGMAPGVAQQWASTVPQMAAIGYSAPEAMAMMEQGIVQGYMPFEISGLATGDPFGSAMAAWRADPQGAMGMPVMFDANGVQGYKYSGVGIANSFANSFGMETNMQGGYGAATQVQALQQGTGMTQEEAQVFLQQGSLGFDRMHRDEMMGFQRAQAGLQLQSIALQQNAYWGANQGGTWDSPAAGSIWNLQDRLTGLQYQSQMKGFQFSMEGMEENRAYDLQSRDIQQRSTELSRGYQRWSTDFNYETSLINRENTRASAQFSQMMSGMNFGWSMEDINEQISRSSGYERKQLITKRERMATSQNLQEGERERGMDAQEELWAREDERYQRNIEYTEEQIQIEDERFQATVEHSDRIYEAQKEHLEYQMEQAKKAHALQMEIQKEQRKLQFESMELQKQMIGLSIAQAEKQEEYRRKMEEAGAEYDEMGGYWKRLPGDAQALKEGVGGVVNGFKDGAREMQRIIWEMQRLANKYRIE